MAKIVTRKALLEQLGLLNQEIENLKTAYSNITNFDKTYNIIMDSYKKSKELLNEQLMQYDKKILENAEVVDTRLNSYDTRINNMIDYTKQQNQEDFNKLRETLRNDVEHIISKYNKINQKFEELNSTYKENMNEQKKDFEDSISSRKSELESNLEKKVSDYEEKQKNNVSQIKEELHSEIEKSINEVNELSQKTIRNYEINLKSLIDSSITRELNNVIVENVIKESTDKILTAFNKSLVELNETEKKSIIESIKALITPKLNLITNKQEKIQIAPLGKDELFHESYDKLKLCVKAGIIPMIVGPAGTGKSTAAEQLSRDLGVNFYMANRIQNTFELVGFVNAAGEYVTTQFYEAYTKGGIFLFDEVDASSPEALVTINAAIAQGYMAFPGHPTALPMHKDFKAICAGNTFGTGSTLQYTGRNKLDAATLDRFMIIEWDYDKGLEDKIIKDKELLKLCWALRVACPGIDKSIIISTRGIITLEKMLVANKETKTFLVKDLFRQKFFENVSKASLKKIYNAIYDECKGNYFLKYIGELSE